MKNYDPTLLEEAGAAIGIAGLLLTSPILRGWYAGWGATPEEKQAHLPGDEIVAESHMTVTRAITIQAPAEQVWAWLAQIGQERGGLYSYQRLENLAGCQMLNANDIRPEWQALEVGQNVRLGPKGYPLFRITAIEPYRALVMQACEPVSEQPGPASWIFLVTPLGSHETRLLTRSRNGSEWTFGNRLMWRGLVDPIHFVMERRMLIGIQARAEARAGIPT
jgi:hypothetical protein